LNLEEHTHSAGVALDPFLSKGEGRSSWKHPAFTRKSTANGLVDPTFPGVSPKEIRTPNVGYPLTNSIGQAANEYDLRLGMLALKAADCLTRLALSKRSNRAATHKINVGFTLHEIVFRSQQAPHHLGLVLVHSAAESKNTNPWPHVTVILIQV
jgi:hypothetical protein